MINLDSISEEFRFDVKTGRYRWAKGTPGAGGFVSNKVIMTMLENQIDTLSAELVEVADNLSTKNINLGQWQRQSADILKRLHGSSAVLAHGGHQQMSDADWLSVGRKLQQQYYAGKRENPETGEIKRFGLKHLARELRQGKVTPGQLRFRMGMYAKSAKVGYWDAQKQANARNQKIYSYRLTSPGETCPDCLRYESWGVRPSAEHHRPGENSVCGPNCKCREFFITLEEALRRGYSD